MSFYVSNGQVTSINGLGGALTLAAGSNITITPSGNTLTIEATGGGSSQWTDDPGVGIHYTTPGGETLAIQSLFGGVGLGTTAADELWFIVNNAIKAYITTDGKFNLVSDLVLGAGAIAVTMKAPGSGTSYDLTWPTSQGGANEFLQNDGAGNLSWAAGGGGGGANTALSNLASVAINDNLTPASDNAKSLGSSSILWSNVYAYGLTGKTTAGNPLNITAPDSASGGSTNNSINVTTGDKVVGGGRTGSISLTTGTSATGTSGDVSIATGASSGGHTGAFTLVTGAAGADRTSGVITLMTGDAAGSGASGAITLGTTDRTTGTGASGAITIQPGYSDVAASGTLFLKTAAKALSTGTLGTGEIQIKTGSNASTGNLLTETGSGAIDISTGALTGTHDGVSSGGITLTTGATKNYFSGTLSLITGASEYQSGDVFVGTGSGLIDDDGYSGEVSIFTGQVTGTAIPGDISINTGAHEDGTGGNIDISTAVPTGSGQRGGVAIGGLSLNLTGVERGITVNKTITPGGTTGAQTINKMAGTVNFAASASSLTVTNDLVGTETLVWAFVRTNDSTATIKNVAVSSGAFTINLTAAATAETSVGFVVFK